MDISATASMDTPPELQEPLPPGYRFTAPGTHHARTFFSLAAIAVVLALWVVSNEQQTEEPILVCLGAVVLLVLLGLGTRWLDAGDRAEIAQIHDGAYLYFWPLTEQESTAYRKLRLKKQRQFQFWCMLAPWVVGIICAVVFGFWNIIDGKQVHRTFQMSGALAAAVTTLCGGSFVFWWIWSIPRRAALNAGRLPVVFTRNCIRIADQNICPWQWTRSREVKTIERDGSTWLSLDFRELRVRVRGTRVDKIVHEVPIPEGMEHDVPGIVRIYATIPA